MKFKTHFEGCKPDCIYDYDITKSESTDAWLVKCTICDLMFCSDCNDPFEEEDHWRCFKCKNLNKTTTTFRCENCHKIKPIKIIIHSRCCRRWFNECDQLFPNNFETFEEYIDYANNPENECLDMADCYFCLQWKKL